MTIQEAIAEFGDGVGIIKRLEAAGFGVVAVHGGDGGWRELDGRLQFVDYWGGVHEKIVTDADD